jgi:hypothetical protein
MGELEAMEDMTPEESERFALKAKTRSQIL